MADLFGNATTATSPVTGSPQPKFMMMMYFHTRLSEYFLLKDWKLYGDEDAGWMVLCCIATFLLAFSYEALKHVLRWCSDRVSEGDKQRLAGMHSLSAKNTNSNCCSSSATNCVAYGTTHAAPSHDIFQAAPANGAQTTNHQLDKPLIPLVSIWHAAEMTVYAVQLFICYLVMLIAMSYSVWLVMSILLGSTAAYFLFEWRSVPGYAVKHSDGGCSHCSRQDSQSTASA